VNVEDIFIPMYLNEQSRVQNATWYNKRMCEVFCVMGYSAV
jgi:hypothetical protein